MPTYECQYNYNGRTLRGFVNASNESMAYVYAKEIAQDFDIEFVRADYFHRLPLAEIQTKLNRAKWSDAPEERIDWDARSNRTRKHFAEPLKTPNLIDGGEADGIGSLLLLVSVIHDAFWDGL